MLLVLVKDLANLYTDITNPSGFLLVVSPSRSVLGTRFYSKESSVLILVLFEKPSVFILVESRRPFVLILIGFRESFVLILDSATMVDTLVDNSSVPSGSLFIIQVFLAMLFDVAKVCIISFFSAIFVPNASGVCIISSISDAFFWSFPRSFSTLAGC